MRKVLYILYQPYKWLVLVPVFAISTLVLAAVATVLATLVSPRFSSLVCGTLWARLNAYLTPIGVRVIGRERIDPRQSYVIAANHQSGYDVYVLYGWLGLDFKWVLKHELRKAPGLGIGCEKLGHIFIDRSNTEAAIRSIEQAKRQITGGTSVLFFPEGTRSEDGRLLPFKKGAFRMAIDLGLPILPVTLVGTRDILPPNTMRLFPGRARLIFHPPIAVAEYDRGNLHLLMQEVKSAIESGLDAGVNAPGDRRDSAAIRGSRPAADGPGSA